MDQRPGCCGVTPFCCLILAPSLIAPHSHSVSSLYALNKPLPRKEPLLPHNDSHYSDFSYCRLVQQDFELFKQKLDPYSTLLCLSFLNVCCEIDLCHFMYIQFIFVSCRAVISKAFWYQDPFTLLEVAFVMWVINITRSEVQTNKTLKYLLIY